MAKRENYQGSTGAAYRNVINWISRTLLDSYYIRFTMHGSMYIKKQKRILYSLLYNKKVYKLMMAEI